MKFALFIIFVAFCTGFLSCDKKNSDLVEPFTAEGFPQVILFDDEGDGDLEDADEFSFTLTLADRTDPSGKELGGTVIPLKEDVTVLFEIKEWKGMNNPAAYIKGAKALYEIDECSTSEDKGIDLNLVFDSNTGKGSVRFPKDVPEIEVVFETDEDLFEDQALNTAERSITLIVTGVQSTAGTTTYNKALDFKYEILDDEGIHGDWEFDYEDPVAFADFKKLFGSINEDIQKLDADDVDKIEISIEYDEVKIIIELRQMETITECGGTEEVHKVIEVEADLDDLSRLAGEGDIEFTGELEQADKSIKEFSYKGNFNITGQTLSLVLKGEYDDEETDKITLQLKKK